MGPDGPPTVPETGGRTSWYLTDVGEWVRCTVLTEGARGTHSIEVERLPAYREYLYDVPKERIRWDDETRSRA